METKWVYISSEPNLFTVGYYSPNGTFHTDSDHQNREDAAKRCATLNGEVDGFGFRDAGYEKGYHDCLSDLKKGVHCYSNEENYFEDRPCGKIQMIVDKGDPSVGIDGHQFFLFTSQDIKEMNTGDAIIQGLENLLEDLKNGTINIK